MAWQPWSAGTPGVVPGLSTLTPVVNPAPAVLPTGSQYTPEQWAQMQQQNWQQWAQWQQQYQQWHQQYGAEYQKSMSALSQTAQGETNYQPAVPNTSVPPPLPNDTKPPPPPEEPPKELLGPTQNKNITGPPNFMTDPPPNFNTAPPATQPLFNASAPPPRTQPPPNMRSNSGNFNYNSNRSANQYNDKPRNPTPARQDFQGDKRFSQQPPFVAKKPKLEDVPQRPPPSNSTEDMSETEKRFVKQFTEWESQFNKWKDQNMNHPDKEQYKEYEKKWEAWRTQLLERREQMRRKRLGIPETKPSSKPSPVLQSLMSVSFPPPFNKDLDTSKPPPLLSKDSPALKDLPTMKDSLLSRDLPLMKDALLSRDSALKDFAMKDPLDSKDSSMTTDIFAESKSATGTHVTQEKKSEEPEESKADDFLKMSKSNDGIPGLDLVLDGRDEEKKDVDLVTADRERQNAKKDSEEGANQAGNKGADLEAISKGINNILGDQKLLNMLSMVTQNQSNQTLSGSIDTTSRIPSNTDFQGNVNESLPPSASRWSNADQQDRFNRGKPNTSNYDEYSRSSFGGRGGDLDWRDRQEGGNQNDFNSGADNYEGNYQNDNFEVQGDYDRRDTFGRRPDKFRSNENFRGQSFRGGPNNFRGGSDNFRGGSDNFRGGPNKFGGGPGNFRNESDNFRSGPDSYRGGHHNFRGGLDKFRGGRDNFKGGPDNVRGGPEDFPGGPDNFRGGPGNFRGGLHSFRGGQNNFRGGQSNFRRGQEAYRDDAGEFKDESDDFVGEPEVFDDDSGSDNFKFRGSDNFGGPADNYKGSANFGGSNEERKTTFEPPPADNFRRRFESPRDQQNRNDDSNRFENDQREPPDFNRRPPGFQDREFGNNFGSFRSGDAGKQNFHDQDNFRQNERRSFDRKSFTDEPNATIGSFKAGPNASATDKFVRPGNFGRGPNDFNRGPNFQCDRDNFNEDPNMEDDFENSGDHEDWSAQGDNNFDKNQNVAEAKPPALMGLKFAAPPAFANPKPTADIEMREVGQGDKEKEVPLWYPTQIIEYDHKCLKEDDVEVSLDPLRTFDYRHKNVNRIPFPQRPQWLVSILKKYPEFDFVLQRSYEQPYGRYQERYERYTDTPRYESRWNSREPSGPPRRSVDDSNRSTKRFDDYGPSFNRRPHDGPSFLKKDHDRNTGDIEMMDVGREKKYESYRNKSPNNAPVIDLEDSQFDKSDNEKFSQMLNKPRSQPNITLIQDILNPPGRYNRPPRIVIILRGPPGSGKTFLAKLIKDKEVENGGSAPRILSLDDYFMVEQEKEVEVDGKKTKVKEMVYEYEECMENAYRMSLLKSFKKTITDGYFPFIIVDNVNDKVKYFGVMWSFAKQNGFQVYICQIEFDLNTCTKRNIHNRSEAEIQKLITNWEPTPNHHPMLDATSLIQAGSIPEVEMEEINSPSSDDFESQDPEDRECSSKWDNFDCSIDNLAKLDGTNKPLRPSKTMEDYLQCDDEWVSRESKPGQKRVRWADLEERKKQEKMRAIGFVVGQTNWDRMMDPTKGGSALTQTKYIERVRGPRFHNKYMHL